MFVDVIIPACGGVGSQEKNFGKRGESFEQRKQIEYKIYKEDIMPMKTVCKL
ncbi:hypothetical protein M406DRAFT_322008 [Cryphonectria parasitica EP155]|uniref:Uncharacterized protein n=1 Tax=Cryphonectria parasitica (strain ATCC 38755 / EP155) TaxID=660469 RepID=A0A9P4Y316_CRYP1|nr:uncharacterized protein M406DRAFT_322008 [Cryphonectria parasitica EP155]KAF3765593.1 hypothetical protein M406DRAFT_322008 [Cryphonectria parasitica EP155]